MTACRWASAILFRRLTGRVGLRLIDPGNVVNSGGSTTLAVITQLQPITVVFTISEDNLQQVLAQMHKKQTLAVQALDRAQIEDDRQGQAADDR